MSYNREQFEFNFFRVPKDWEILKLEDVTLKQKGAIISGPFGSNISSKFFVDSGVPVIRGNNLTENANKFRDEGFVYVTQEKADSLNTYAIKDDLVFTAAGTIGQVGIINSKCKYEKYIISNKQLRARLDKDIVNPLYAYYWYSTRNMNTYIKLLNTGSTIPLINLSILKSLPIPVPTLKEQERIVDIVSSLDDKIELNNEINKTLEEIAQSLFKRWFVDYEFPNDDGESYKFSGGEMVESELGVIPKGWEVRTLDNIVDITMGVSPKSSSYNTDNIGVPLLNGASDFNGTIINPTKYTTEPKKMCNKGDMVFCIRATIGNLTFTDKEYCIGRGVAGVKPREYIYKELIYFNIKNSINTFIARASGSVFLNLTKDDINKMKVIIPSNDILNKFSNITSNIIDKIQSNNIEKEELVKMRDMILPKLMSGEVRVDNLSV